ncbi:MAG: hypothetical protein LBE80_06140 [Deltaproteobacteria bacterium]|jgi:hypothetical protein|nr:hypothetical protein [Deltaproteobacteria bacterium]
MRRVKRNVVYIVWGKQLMDKVRKVAGPNDTVMAGPMRLSDWPLGVALDYPQDQKSLPLPNKAQIELLKSLQAGLDILREVTFVYPPGLQMEALALRLKKALNLKFGLMATLTDFRPQGVESALKGAKPLNWNLANFQEARLSLQNQAETIMEYFFKELGLDLPFSTSMSPVLNVLSHYREIQECPEEKRPIVLKVESFPLEEGLYDIGKYGLSFGTLRSPNWLNKASFVVKEAEAKRILSFFEIDEDFFEVHAQVEGKKLYTITAVEKETEPFDILGLAAAAQQKHELSVSETLYWLEYLFMEGYINWPFESLDLQPVPVYSNDTRVTDLAYRPRLQGPSIRVFDPKDLNCLTEPAKTLFALICKRAGQSGKKGSKAKEAPEVNPLSEVISYTRKSQKGYQSIKIALTPEEVKRIHSEPISRLLNNLKTKDYDSFLKSPYDPTIWAIAAELSSKGIMSLKSVNGGVNKLERKQCLTEIGGHVMATKRGRVFDKILSHMSLANPENLRQVELELYKTSFEPCSSMDLDEALREIFDKSMEEAKSILGDQVYLKNMCSMFDDPYGLSPRL